MDERAGQAQALLLAPGQDPSGGGRHVLQVDDGQHLGGAPGRLPGLDPLGDGEGLEDLGAGQGVPGAEAVRHPPDDAVDLPGLGDRVEAVDANGPGIGTQEGCEHEQQRGLASAVGTHQARDGAAGYGHTQAPHRRGAAEGTGHVDDLNTHRKMLPERTGYVQDRSAGVVGVRPRQGSLTPQPWRSMEVISLAGSVLLAQQPWPR